jgi:hypothetical protein
MSNGNVIERLWKLEASAKKLILDGKRAPEQLCDLLQKFIGAAALSPVAFIGKGWSFAEARNPRSAALELLDDYSKVKLTTSWLEGQPRIDGETRRTRILADTASTPLHADHFLDLWNNKEKIPEDWKKVKGVITFDGDVLRSPRGDRCVLCLCWDGGEWYWDCRWLGSGWDVVNPSAVLAS